MVALPLSVVSHRVVIPRRALLMFGLMGRFCFACDTSSKRGGRGSKAIHLLVGD